MTTINRMTPQQAWQSLQETAGAVLLDVRDKIEFSLVGHAPGALNIPWKLAPTWQPNNTFLQDVKDSIPDVSTPIFLICRSGQRSFDAAGALANEGYTCLTNVEEGFEGPLNDQKHRSTLAGWRFHNLPWEQN